MSTELFTDLPPIVADWLDAHLDTIELDAGEILFREGDPGHDLFIVEHGRLLATRSTPTDDNAYLGELGRGEPVGEMAILTEEPRSATVRAIRKTSLHRLGSDDFISLLAEHPHVLRPIAERLIERVRDASRPSKRSPAATVAVIPVTPGLDGRVVVEALSNAALRAGLNADTSDTYSLNLEADNDLLALTPGTDRTEIIEAVQHADRVLFTARAGVGFDRELVEQVISHTPITRRDLVLQHPDALRLATGTQLLTVPLNPARVHHLRAGDALDHGRLLRSITDTEIGLVLSGGGARGLAHIGVWQALAERGIPLDAIAGTSAGSIIAAMAAHIWPANQMLHTFKTRLGGQRAALDLTAPALSLASGEKITGKLQETFGRSAIEDLWLAFYAVSTNLTKARPQIHSDGSLWRAVRSSIAVPGVFPPMTDGEDVLVDGGITNNLPVNAIRQNHPGATVVAVDVGNERELKAQDLARDGVVSGWSLLGRRLNPFVDTPQLHGLMSILMRVTELGASSGDDRGDLLIRPEVGDFGLFDFGRIDDLAAAGYEATQTALDKGGEAADRLMTVAEQTRETR